MTVLTSAALASSLSTSSDSGTSSVDVDPARVTSRAASTPLKPSTYQAPYTNIRDHNRWRFHADGTFEQWVTLEVRPESEDGALLVGEREITFNQSLQEVKVLEAYTLLPDGRRVDVAKDKIRLKDGRDSDGIYSDLRNWVLIFPHAQVGSKLVYSYYIKQHTQEFTGHFAYSEHIRPNLNWDSYRLEVQVDPGVQIRHWQRGMTGGEVPAIEGDAPGTRRFRFDFSRRAEHAPEPSAVALAHYAPGVAFSTFNSYSQVAQAYQLRARPKAEPTDSIRALAAELIRGHVTAQEKVRAIYQWVTRNIRYVGVYTGVGGVVPNDAQSVLDHRYGDCKDHVVLMEALLRAAGIESSPALVHSDNLHILPELPTPFAFDHVINYIPSLDWFLDATAEFVQAGSVPAGLMGQPTLITATGDTRTIPKKDLTKNYTESRAHMTLRRDGSVIGSSQLFMHGSYEAYSRNEQANNQRWPMERVVNNWLRRFMESGRGEITHPDPRSMNEPWSITTAFELEPVINVPGPSAMMIPGGLSLGYIRDTAQTPAFLSRSKPRSCYRHRHVEVVMLDFSPGLKLTHMPKDVSVTAGVYRYEARYQRTENGIKAARELIVDHPLSYCTPTAERHWYDIAQVIKRDLRSQLFFE